MAPVSMTLSDLWPTFQGNDNIQLNNSTNSKSCMIYPMVLFPVTLSDP